MVLEGTTGKWIVTLHNDDVPELWRFDHFMGALQKHFQDLLADCKARTRIRTINQGHHSIAAYTHEFCNLACRLTDWPQNMLIECFQDGLNDDVYNTCISRGTLTHMLHAWYALAEDVEIDLACSRNQPGRVWRRSLPEKKEALKPPAHEQSPHQHFTGCFKCGKEGHQAAECRATCPTQKRAPEPTKKSAKPPQRT